MTEHLFESTLVGSIGTLRILSTSKGLAAIGFGQDPSQRFERWLQRTFPGASKSPAGKRHGLFESQIRQYLEGRRRVFNLPLDLRGSDFQKTVWAGVARVPFGQTATYGEIALLAGRPRASRAVGAANGANPIPIIIPCHRVVGADGSLTGYGGGLEIKRQLLAHEGKDPTYSVAMGLDVTTEEVVE